MNFFRAKLQAKRLTYHACLSQARISSENRHYCHECFTCACLAVIREHRSHLNWTGKITDTRDLDWDAFLLSDSDLAKRDIALYGWSPLNA